MFNIIINKMKSDSKEARNVFNCEPKKHLGKTV